MTRAARWLWQNYNEPFKKQQIIYEGDMRRSLEFSAFEFYNETP